MKKISIKNINKESNTIRIFFESTLEQYLREEYLEIRYDFDVSQLPVSVAIIPFVANVLPIIWLTNAELIVEELDEDFYHSIDEFKKGYVAMYPMLNFGGKITIKHLIKNKQPDKKKTALFFSGGVDAFSSLIELRKDKTPDLITIWGADVMMANIEGWQKVEKHIKETAGKFHLPYQTIQSNFRTFIDEFQLDKLVATSGDGYWHGFQHGVGMLALAAPYAYLEGVENLYIASSYTKELHHSCASDPSIDNFVKFCGTSVIHHQFELSRQMKIKNIVSAENKINLRVCWESTDGDNCCRCEKCYRTIAGLWAEGKNPIDYGFRTGKNFYKSMISDFTTKIYLSDIVLCLWKEIQSRFVQNESNVQEKHFLRWIKSVNLDKINNTWQKQLKRNSYRRLFVKFVKKWLK